MRSAHSLALILREPLAMLPAVVAEIISLSRTPGELTREEIRARLGDHATTQSRASTRNGVAVLPIRGVIVHRRGSFDEIFGDTSCEGISAMLRQSMADSSIGTIVLDIHSPGGTVAGVSELASEISAARRTKRVVAQVNSLCASAAYHLAAQAHEIVAIPSATVGGIGVFVVHASLERAFEKQGVEISVLQFGDKKLEGSPFSALTDDAREHLQRQVNEAGERFVSDVARGRGVSPAFVRSHYGDGRCFGAKGAKAAGLIDRIGTLAETVDRIVAAPTERSAAMAEMLDLQLQMLALGAPWMARRVTTIRRDLAANEVDRLRLEIELLRL